MVPFVLLLCSSTAEYICFLYAEVVLVVLIGGGGGLKAGTIQLP